VKGHTRYGIRTAGAVTAALVVVLAAVYASSTTASPNRVSASRSTVVVALIHPLLGGLDATQTVESYGKTASFLVSQPLVGFSEKTHAPVPELATSWTVSRNHLIYTFNLRRGVKFQDGTPFNAAAVVISLMREYDSKNPLFADGKYPYTSSLPLKTVQKVNNYTVRIIATKPDPLFLWELSLEPGRIQSPTAMRKWGKNYSDHAVGTGPYEVVSCDEQHQAILTRFNGYWGRKPAVQKLIFKVETDPTAMVADLLSGGVDVISQIPVDQVPRLQNSSGVSVQTFPLRWISDIVLNTSHSPFDNVLVRRAVAYGFDSNTLNRVLNRGLTRPLHSLWIPGQPGYNPKVAQYPFNPTRAEQLLDQAGWTLAPGQQTRSKSGVPLNITLVTNGQLTGFQAAIPVLFQQNMKAIGINVTIKPIDSSVFFDPKAGIFNKNNFDASVLGWIPRLPDFSVMAPIVTTAGIPPNGFNASYYSNPTVDNLFNEASTNFNSKKRFAELEQAQAILAQDEPVVVDSQFTEVVAFRKGIAGINWLPNDVGDLSALKVTG